MQHMLSRFSPILLCLALCVGVQGDDIADLIKAAVSNNDAAVQAASEKLLSKEGFPDNAASNALKKNFESLIQERDKGKMAKFEAAIFVLLDVISIRGGYICVDACIPIVGLGQDIGKAADRALGRITCHMIVAVPKLPAKAEKSEDPNVNRQTAWAFWWDRNKGRKGVNGKEPWESALVNEGLAAKGVRVPPREKWDPKNINQIVTNLLKGCTHGLEYVRYWSSRLLSEILGKDFMFDSEEQDAGKRAAIIGQMKAHWAKNKRKIIKILKEHLKPK